METNMTPSWLSTWQAICEQEAQSQIRYKKFMEEWYRIETNMKLMDLKVDAMMKMRDEYLNHLFQKYPNWKPTFKSYGLRSSTTTQDNQSDLYRMMETEIRRNLQQRDTTGIHMHQPTFTQAIANSSGQLLSAYYNRQARPNIGYAMHQMPTSHYMPHYPTHHDHGFTSDQPSEMAELKTEMGQIKSRLEDITVYLRELRHSAIELTTSVSRRSSMRDKERKRVPILERDEVFVSDDDRKPAFVRANTVASEKNVLREERKQDAFIDQVKDKLLQENRVQSTHTVHYQDEDDDEIEMNYQPKPVQAPKEPKQNRDVPKEAEIIREKTIINEKIEKSDEKMVPKGPRFDFSGASQKPVVEAPKPIIEPPKPKPQSPQDDFSESSSVASDSPPATATWLMSGATEKPKSAPVAPKVQTTASQKLEVPQPKKPPAPMDSSPGSSPEIIRKISATTGSGYQALLGAVSKGQSETKAAPAAITKSDGSESDDLDDALANVVKLPATAGSAASTRPRDASLSDIFSFGKDEKKKEPTTIMSPEKPKTAPAPVVTKSKETGMTKKDIPVAEPDDFLKKLFPDKFAAPGGGKAASAAGDGARKKKPAFFMGDDSDDDIDLPQGKSKSDDLDDDFFFR